MEANAYIALNTGNPTFVSDYDSVGSYTTILLDHLWKKCNQLREVYMCELPVEEE